MIDWMHYKKPERIFQESDGVYIIDLMEQAFIHFCKGNLLTMYKQIEKGDEVELPKGKKDLSSLNLVYIALKESGLQYGFNPKEKLQELHKGIPQEVLKCGEVSRFDMSEQLKKELWP